MTQFAHLDSKASCFDAIMRATIVPEYPIPGVNVARYPVNPARVYIRVPLHARQVDARQVDARQVDARQVDARQVDLPWLQRRGYLDMRQADAAHKLGMTPHELRMHCLRLGMTSWPYKDRQLVRGLRAKIVECTGGVVTRVVGDVLCELAKFEATTSPLPLCVFDLRDALIKVETIAKKTYGTVAGIVNDRQLCIAVGTALGTFKMSARRLK
jgi:hypothetical protein